MTTLRTAAQQALEALTDFFNAYPHMAKGYTEDALTDLRAALAQQDEPCPNCASLEAQNTELDRKLAEMERAEPTVPSELDELIDLGHKAGTLFLTQFGVASATPEWLENFATLVAAAEREACAKVAEEPYEFTSAEASRIATAIRARSEP